MNTDILAAVTITSIIWLLLVRGLVKLFQTQLKCLIEQHVTMRNELERARDINRAWSRMMTQKTNLERDDKRFNVGEN